MTNRFWPRLAAFFAAAFILSMLLNIDATAERLVSWHLISPSIDVWLLLIPLALAACRGKQLLFRITLPIWALFLVLPLIRIGDTVVPLYLERPFNLYIDSGYLFGLYDLLKTSAPQGKFPLLAALAVTVISGFCLLSWSALRLAGRAFASDGIRYSFLGGSGIVAGAFLVGLWQPAGTPALVRLGQEIASIRLQIKEQQVFVARLEQTAKARAETAITLNGLGKADVFVFVVESYGRVVFSQPQYQKAMEATMARIGTKLEQQGFEAVSSYLASPTFGGSSWLAHATLESGVRVANDLEEIALVRSSLQPMASLFRQNGYRTVSVMPGTRFAFPQGAYFGFEQVYYAPHFNYHGPAYGWAAMPDQFVLDWVHRREVAERKQPLFARYVLISSHSTYNIQPTYIDDWERIGDGNLFHDRGTIYYPFYWQNLKDAGEAYLRSLDYEFTILGDYLARYVTADSLVIILGDHQPPVQLTGAGESWSVPVHIISRNPNLLAPFRKRGYTTGLIPAQPPPHAGMETFLPAMLDDFK